jgi:large subunit ribosomal protein L18
MKSIGQKRIEAREKRHRRIRKKVRGTPGQPRLSVFRSLKNITAQLHDDVSGRCLITVTSLSGEVRERMGGTKPNKSAVSGIVGKVLAEKAKALGVERVVFDRGGYLYHGRVKALAEAAREGGLKF